jgi:hypothetical protein
MRSFLSPLIITLIAAACAKEPTAPAPAFHITATISGSNGCTVNAPDAIYSSSGVFNGDQPKKFVSTYDKNYHGFWCWVSVDGGASERLGAGNFFLAFSGNTLGKPLAVGKYGISFDMLDDTPPMTASVRFQTLNLNGDEYRALDNAAGSVVVDSAADGTRTVHVDLQVVRYSYHL